MRFLDILFLSTVALVVTYSPRSANADDIRHNAWGLFAGPTTYELVNGSDYDRAASSTSLDWGIYYTRVVTRKFSIRVEARLASRHIDIVNGSFAVPASSYDIVGISRIDEHILEIPLLIQGDRRSSFGDGEIRLSTGIGVSYGVLIDQHMMNLVRDIEQTEGFGGYQRLSLLFDGGGTVDIDPGDAIFLRFRVAYDAYVFGETSDLGAATEYFSFGFYAGFESSF